jgi:tRNA modification GTPase
MSEAADTIAAIATPPGRGAIGIVRVSGPASSSIARQLTGRALQPRHAHFAAFRRADGSIIDRGIALFFGAPASSTGEDVLELHAHGGPVVLDMLLRRVLEAGAQPAAPGEFTERAFLNGKLDLLQAEAVADLIDSASERAARAAQRSLAGEFSTQVDGLRAALLEMRARLEAVLDFPDEPLPDRDIALAALPDCRQRLAQLLGTARSGRALARTLRVVIAGPPNVGKSSLMNRLLQVERAIVSDQAGTTRDTIEDTLCIGGCVLRIVDTAGLRASADAIEAEGVRRTRAALADADLVLLVSDRDEEPLEPPPAARRAPVVRVRNKIDLCGRRAALTEQDGVAYIALSAVSGAGIDLLCGYLGRLAGAADGGEDAPLARERHILALDSAARALERAQAAGENGAPPELIAEELRSAQDQLGRVTGAVGAEELLGEIFARFCIGK